MKTDSEVWLKLAETFDRAEPADDGVFEVSIEGCDVVCGICDALYDLCLESAITPYRRETMRKDLLRLAPHFIDGTEMTFWWDTRTLRGNKERVLACCLLSAMTAQEKDE